MRAPNDRPLRCIRLLCGPRQTDGDCNRRRWTATFNSPSIFHYTQVQRIGISVAGSDYVIPPPQEIYEVCNGCFDMMLNRPHNVKGYVVSVAS